MNLCIFSTNITDEGRVRSDMKRNWDDASEELRKDYGENYITKYQVM